MLALLCCLIIQQAPFQHSPSLLYRFIESRHLWGSSSFQHSLGLGFDFNSEESIYFAGDKDGDLPVTIMYKTFVSGSDCRDYYSRLLNQLRLDQDLNEVSFAGDQDMLRKPRCRPFLPPQPSLPRFCAWTVGLHLKPQAPCATLACEQPFLPKISKHGAV